MEDNDCLNEITDQNIKSEIIQFVEAKDQPENFDKLAFKNFLMNYDIVKANMLNIICTRCQNISKRLWLSNNGDIESKILKFLKIHSLQPNGEKRLKIKMEDLARLMGESRINVSRALNAMQDRGIAELKRKEIIIFDIEKATEGI